MTVLREGSTRFTGVAADTKPTTYGGIAIPTNALFFESDTGKTFYYTGSAWTEQSITGAAGGTVAVSGGGTGATTFTAGILKASGTSPFTTVAAPSGVIVGTTDTQTLSGKNIAASANTFSGVHGNPFFGKKTGAFYPRAASAVGTGSLAVMVSAITGVGTGVETSNANDANGTGSILDTAATINSIAGFKSTTMTVRRFNPMVMFRFQLVATSAFRFFAGFSSGASSNPASNSDYLNALSGVGLWVDSAVSANWKIMNNDGSGASTITDTTTAFDANVHTLSITAIDATPSFVVQLDGATMTNGTVTGADQPAQTMLMGTMIYIENTTAASKTCNYYKMWIEADL